MFLWGLFGPWFGIVTDKYGGHIAVFIGFVFYLIGILLLYSGINKGFYFIVSMGILIGIGLGATAVSIPVSVVSKHFPSSNRTIATGIVTAAGSFGYFISPLFTRMSLVEYGWQDTLLFFSIFVVIGLGLAFLLTTPKTTEGDMSDDKQTAMEAIKEAFANKSYIYLTLGFFVCGWHITLVATHIPAYLNDKGLPGWCAATLLSMIGLFNIFGTLTCGYLSTKFPKKFILSFIYFARGIVIAFFIFLPPSPTTAILFGITFGFLWLATVPPTAGMVSFIFGTKYMGLLYGIVFLSHQIGSFFGAYLGGLFKEIYGSYDYAWYLSIALSIFAGLIHLPIKEKQVQRLQVV
jgi:MFS family permease